MTTKKETVMNIALEKLVPFRDHPFQARDDEQMQMITESIRSVSGLIFGLVHLTNIVSGVNPARAAIQVISACAIGMYYTAIYFRGGNLWVLMMIHCFTDAGGLFRSAFTTAATAVGEINDLSITGLIMIPVYLGLTAFLLRKKKMDAVLENLRQAAECDR